MKQFWRETEFQGEGAAKALSRWSQNSKEVSEARSKRARRRVVGEQVRGLHPG